MFNSYAIARWNYFWSRLAQAFLVLVRSRSENAKTHDGFPTSVGVVAAGTCSIVKSPLWTQWWQHYLWKHDQTQSTMGIRLFSFGFRLVLGTVLSVLSACDRPPKLVFNDNRQVCARLTWCVLLWASNIVLMHTKGRLTAEAKPGHCSVELWSPAKHTGPSLPIQTAYPTTTHRAWGTCRWTHHVTFSTVLPLHCSGQYCNGTSLQTAAQCRQIPFPPAPRSFAAVVAAIFACKPSASSTQRNVLHRLSSPSQWWPAIS